MKHFVHYLSREIKQGRKQDYFFALNQSIDEGFDRPMFHVTRRKAGIASQIEIGSTIWVFSILKSPWGNLPPSLDAKIIVEKVEHLPNGLTKFHAHPKSKWFPLYDASKLLRKLYSIDKAGNETEIWPDKTLSLGLYLQSIRQIKNGDELLDYENTLSNTGISFISYRIKDGTKAAFDTTRKLISECQLVFWDRYCLPRRLVERREYISDDKLDRYLIEKIYNAKDVFGIETPKYAEQNSYSLKEAQIAKKLNKYIPIVSTSANSG